MPVSADKLALPLPYAASGTAGRIDVKLGAVTRTLAAGMAMNRIKQLHPQFEG